MLTLHLQRPWAEVKEKLLEAEPMLTEEDLQYDEARPEELLLRLGKKMDRSTEHIKGWIESVAFTEGRAG